MGCTSSVEIVVEEEELPMPTMKPPRTKSQVSFRDATVHEFPVEAPEVRLPQFNTLQELTLEVFLKMIEDYPQILAKKVERKRRRDFGLL